MGLSLLGAMSSILSTCSRHVSRAAQKLRPGNPSQAAPSRRSSIVPAISPKRRTSGRRKRGSGSGQKRKLAGVYEEEEEEEDGVWRRTILMGEKCQPLDFSGVICYDANGRILSEIPTPRSPLRSPLPSFAAKVPVAVGYDGKGEYD